MRVMVVAAPLQGHLRPLIPLAAACRDARSSPWPSGLSPTSSCRSRWPPAGAIAAGRVGVPSVLQENLLFAAPELLAAVAASAPMLKYSVPAPELSITVSPPSLVGPRPGRQMRPVPWSGGGDVPLWLLAPADRPRIVVSRSTVPGPGGGDPTKPIVSAARRLDAEIVLVRPPAKLAAGVPQLVVPGAGDRRHNAGLVARRGAGLAVEAEAITVATLRQLIDDDGLAAAAREVRDEIAAMPAPAELVPELEALVRNR